MNWFLIDFENVQSSACVGILNYMREDDYVVIFYSDKCKNISLDVLEEFLKAKVKIATVKAIVGTKDALDFQLSSYLGCLIAKRIKEGANKDESYFVVSRDKGYDCMCKFWANQGIKVARISPDIVKHEVITIKEYERAAKELEMSRNLMAAGAMTYEGYSPECRYGYGYGYDEPDYQFIPNNSMFAVANKEPESVRPLEIFSEIIVPQKEKSVKNNEDVADAEYIGQVPLKREEARKVHAIFNKCKKCSKLWQELCKLIKDSKKASTVYQELKPLMEEKERNLQKEKDKKKAEKEKAKKAEKTEEGKKDKKSKTVATLEEIEEVLPKSEDSQRILEIFNKSKTYSGFCNELVKYFCDGKRASAVYKKLKPLLKEKGKKKK
jgi:hypothetical protein